MPCCIVCHTLHALQCHPVCVQCCSLLYGYGVVNPFHAGSIIAQPKAPGKWSCCLYHPCFIVQHVEEGVVFTKWTAALPVTAGSACDFDACLALHSFFPQAMHRLLHIHCGAEFVPPTLCTVVLAAFCIRYTQFALCTWHAANGAQTALGELSLTSGQLPCQTITSALSVCFCASVNTLCRFLLALVRANSEHGLTALWWMQPRCWFAVSCQDQGFEVMQVPLRNLLPWSCLQELFITIV